MNLQITQVITIGIIQKLSSAHSEFLIRGVGAFVMKVIFQTGDDPLKHFEELHTDVWMALTTQQGEFGVLSFEF